MKMRDRSSYPDSPHPGHGHPSDWIAKPYSIVFTGVVLFILILGIAIFLGWRQFETTRHNALTADKTTANLLADLILEHNKATIGILQSYAHRPLFIDAVKNKDVAGVHRHLSDLKKNAEIDLTFVTDKRGIHWANFPVFPESRGKDFSQSDWYKGISAPWKPYISTVFKLMVGDKPLAVAVCVPIFDEKERVIGILASSQRLGFLVDAIRKVPFSPYTTVNVIDRAGQILYSNKVPYQESIMDYRFFPILEPALKENKQQIEMNHPQKDQEKSDLTVVPVGDIGWSVIIERSLKDIYRSDLRSFIEIGAVSILLFLLIIFFLVYLRKVSLFRKTEELLQAETKLRQSEENFHHSLDNSPMGVRIVTEEGETIYANWAILDIYGYDSMEDLKTTPVEKRYTPESHADFLIRREKRQQGVDVPAEYTINIIRKDGEVRHLLVLRREVLWDGERQFQVLYNDITDRKWAEVALRESEERLRTIIEASLDAIIAVNVEGRLVLFNGAAQELFQYSEEEALNQPVDILLREEIGKIHQERLERFLNRGVGQCGHIGRRTERPFRRKDGSLFEGEVSMSGGRRSDGLRLVVFAIHDITTRKKAEEMLRESEMNYKDLVENANSIIIRMDQNGILTFVNDYAQKFFGYTWDEIIGRNVKIIVPPDESSGRNLKEMTDNILSDPDHYIENINENIRKNRERVWISWRNKGIKDSNGNIVGNLAIGQDITERKRTEEELQESKYFVERILETTPNLIYIYDLLEQRNAYANREVMDFLGYTPEQIQAFGSDLFQNILHPDDALLVAQHHARFATVGEGVVLEIEYRMKHANGQFRWLHSRDVLFTRNRLGENRQILGSSEDITERKRVEEELKKRENLLQKVFDVLPVGLWFTDKDGKLLRGNPAGVKIWGAEPKVNLSELGIFKARRLPSGEEIEPEDWALAHTVRKKITIIDEMLEIDAFDGKKKIILNYTAPVLDDQGAIQGAVVVNLDITDRKQAEEELRASRSQLRALAARLQQIREEERLMVAREIHDEMGGGLTGLKMDLSWLLGKMGDADTCEARVALMDRIQTSNTLIDQMIHIVRRISTDLRPSVLDDLGLIAALEWQLSEFTSRTEISHEFATTFKDVNMEDDTAIAVFRIFQEALTNVVRHSRATKVAVVLREGERSLFGDESFVLEIRDNGRGITEEEILNPGSLGLLGMKERVLTFGGELSISGEPGGGTALVLKIPRKQGESS